MGKLLVKEKDIVVPGQELANGMDYLPAGGSFRDKENIISSQLGLVSIDNRVIKIIPLTGKYIPKLNDIVIGRIADMGFSGWYVDINCAYEANLMIRDASEFIDRGADLTQFHDFNELIVAKIVQITRFSKIDLSMKGPGLHKIKGGKIIEITPSKVPRIIGKQGSMVNLLKEKTNCQITVGQNGRIWIQGNNSDDELKATEAILKIESESHVDGLTDKMKEFLEGKKK
ncbi:MAG: exosome complex protein Rrp4 [Nanoarchaeota archaeon]|nr:exosome complex protein Rrp4 [Nanoarchaeota archaeon]